MEKVIAFDYGQKKIGVAISQNTVGLRIKYISNNKFTFDEIKRIIELYNIDTIIVGVPLKLDGEDSTQSKYCKKFVEKIKENFPQPVIIAEESLTTKIALQNLRLLGFNKDQIQNEKDSESARILLQEYLDNLS